MPPPPPQPPPTLPKISGDPDILLDIYTHESIQFPGMNMEKNTEYGDTKRLACLGHKAYELFATEALFSKKPLLNADVLQSEIVKYCHVNMLNEFVTHYGLRDKIRCTQETKAKLKSDLETRKIWYSYMGALYLRNGTPATKAFVTRLIDPDASADQNNGGARHSSPPPQMHGHQSGGFGGQYSSTHTPSAGGGYSGYPPPPFSAPPPPSSAPPPMPNGPPPASHYGASNGPPPASYYGASNGPPPASHYGGASTGIPANQVTLALMNQTAVQRRYQVTYTQQNHGPPHMPTWYCVCYVNGEEKGHGQGKNLKQAKEQAAQMAWASMGW
ncbi:hypothetical protein BDV98DRAFT_591406 [Pterulicium gracile]|uniref:DRBM domain-containing protein n=1 Tax=Pterulicium gracile TaxID=1884261 RepID=A0A5C3QSQ0_9AGAR|nr:hypothetical protein BDV98DRAFT_591406 [Pterula gracilis]